MSWLRNMDERLFSPPHTFPAVLALIAARLGLFADMDLASPVDEVSPQKGQANVPSELK
jgi:hypothetical protein